MAFNKDYFFYLIETVLGKNSTYTGSCLPKNKFSDVVQYIRDGKFSGTSLAGQVMIDSDLGTLFQYKYLFNRKDPDGDLCEIKISHFGETIRSMEITTRESGAAYCVKQRIKEMEAALPKFDGSDSTSSIPKVDYSGKELSELLDIIDQKIQAFSKNANITTFNEILPVKDAIEAKINSISLAERGKFSAPIKNLNMYISTLKTQLASPMLDVSQFAGTYVSQMQSAIIDIAQLIS